MVSLFFVRVAIVEEIAGNVHLDLGRPKPHLKEELIEVNILGADSIGGGIVLDEIELDLDNSQHGGL